jgi:glycosyltransferase involved in cell wall biosynthesis
MIPMTIRADHRGCALPARLTIAIPFYTGGSYLQRAIASVRRQTSAAWQLFICDDCGPEPGIAELVHSYRDPRITYHRNERNLGMAGNWNRCLDLAATDLVSLLHADDELLKGYVDLMTRAADHHPRAVAFFCSARIIDARGRVRFSLPDFVKRFLIPPSSGPLALTGRSAVEALLRGDFIMCPTLCYRTSILGARRFAADWKFAHDLEFLTRLLLEGETLVGLAKAAYAYRRHAGNATTRYTHSLLRFDEEVQLYNDLGRAAAQRGWRRAGELARNKRIIKLNLAICTLTDLLHGRLHSAREKLRYISSLHEHE